MRKPVSLITGVGDGTGASLARRFARGGYQVAMVARNQVRLDALQEEISDSRAYACDISDLAALTDVVARIRAAMGQPSVLIHNAVSATFKTFLEADSQELEHNFRVNTTSLYELARELAPAMIKHGNGAIMVTGNSAAHRGVPNYAAFAPTKAAQRILAQALARQLGPKGIHVAYITIDAAINTPCTGDVINHNKPDHFSSNPADIADEVFRITLQPPSAWSFDVEIRPYGENW
jgi:short-subunit dehydrogenase